MVETHTVGRCSLGHARPKHCGLTLRVLQERQSVKSSGHGEVALQVCMWLRCKVNVVDAPVPNLKLPENLSSSVKWIL